MYSKTQLRFLDGTYTLDQISKRTDVKYPRVVWMYGLSDNTPDDIKTSSPKAGTLVLLERQTTVEFVRLRVEDFINAEDARPQRDENFYKSRQQFVGQKILLPLHFPGKLTPLHRPLKRQTYTSISQVYYASEVFNGLFSFTTSGDFEDASFVSISRYNTLLCNLLETSDSLSLLPGSHRQCCSYSLRRVDELLVILESNYFVELGIFPEFTDFDHFDQIINDVPCHIRVDDDVVINVPKKVGVNRPVAYGTKLDVKGVILVDSVKYIECVDGRGNLYALSENLKMSFSAIPNIKTQSLKEFIDTYPGTRKLVRFEPISNETTTIDECLYDELSTILAGPVQIIGTDYVNFIVAWVKDDIKQNCFKVILIPDSIKESTHAKLPSFYKIKERDTFTVEHFPHCNDSTFIDRYPYFVKMGSKDIIILSEQSSMSEKKALANKKRYTVSIRHEIKGIVCGYKQDSSLIHDPASVEIERGLTSLLHGTSDEDKNDGDIEPLYVNVSPLSTTTGTKTSDSKQKGNDSMGKLNTDTNKSREGTRGLYTEGYVNARYHVHPDQHSTDFNSSMSNDVKTRYDSNEKDLKAVNEFYNYSVDEIVDCFRVCALPEMATLCKQERLDGSYFQFVDVLSLEEPPFTLSSFQIKKFKKIVNGWRPK